MKVGIVNTFKMLKNYNRSAHVAAKHLELSQKPVIAEMQGYYAKASEKLSDIYLDRKADDLRTDVVQHNIKEFDNLPEAIKKCIKPSDIDRNGHIDQKLIDDLWKSGKETNAYGVWGNPPRFEGGMEDAADSVADGSSELMDSLTDNATEVGSSFGDAIEHGISKVLHWLSDIIG